MEPKTKSKTKSKFLLAKPAFTPSVLGPSRVKADVQFLLPSATTSTTTSPSTLESASAAASEVTAKERSRVDCGIECARVVEFDSRSIAQPFLDGEVVLERVRRWRYEIRLRREAGT